MVWGVENAWLGSKTGWGDKRGERAMGYRDCGPPLRGAKEWLKGQKYPIDMVNRPRGLRQERIQIG